MDETRPAPWQLKFLLAGCVLLLVGMLLPVFPDRVTRAISHFSDDTVISSTYDVLVHNQHYEQDEAPTVGESLKRLSIVVAAVRGHWGAPLTWFVQAVISSQVLQLWSFMLWLLVPLAAGLLIGIPTARAVFQGVPFPHKLIQPAVYLALLALLAVPFAWLETIDFNMDLLPLDGRLAPTPSFYIWLAGAVLTAAAALFYLPRLTNRKVFSWWVLVFVAALTIWLLARFMPHPYYDIWLFISDGIVVTLKLVVVSFAFILVVSLLGGLGRLSKNSVIYGISSLYVEVIRGIPLLVQLLFIWYALPQVFDGIGNALLAISPSLEGAANYFLELRLDAFTAAVVGLTICYGAYGSEVFRAGIASIHSGQLEAARSLGMSSFQAMRYIVLPQAIRVILPPVGNEFVALLKDSTLVSVLAVSDLTRRGREYMSRTFLSFETWILVALCYLVLTLFASRIVEYIESRSKAER